MSLFSAHSTIPEALSRVSDKFLNLAEVSKGACWSNAKT